MESTHASELQFGIVAKDTTASLHEWATQVLANPSMIQATQNTVEEVLDYVSISTEDSTMISLSEALGLLESVIHLSNLTKSIWKQFPKGASLFHYQFLPLSPQCPAYFFHEQPQADLAESVTSLDHVIAAWGMERLPVCGDGNCCFSAVASGMIISHSQTDFHEVGIQSMDNADIFDHQLCPIAVIAAGMEG